MRETGPGGKHNTLKMIKKKKERALVLSCFSLVEFFNWNIVDRQPESLKL